MTISLLFDTLLRRSNAGRDWCGFRTPPPPTEQTFDGDDEPEPQREPPFWTYFVENPRPTSTERKDNI